MVDTGVDQGALHNQRAYDVIKSEQFMAQGIVRPAGADTEGRLNSTGNLEQEEVVDQIVTAAEAAAEASAETAQEAEATIAVDPSAQQPEQQDPGAAGRHMRLGVCACIVVVLLFAWVIQRKNGKVR